MAYRPGQQPAHCRPGTEGVAFGTQGFSLINSGNRTLHAPKRSWKITLESGTGHLAGMTCINLKSMYNDPSQMREALAWRLFRHAAVPAARHTYGKLAFDATYYGLFSVIEQVDKRFLKDHLRRQPLRQPVQGLLRGRRMRHPGTGEA